MRLYRFLDEPLRIGVIPVGFFYVFFIIFIGCNVIGIDGLVPALVISSINIWLKKQYKGYSIRQVLYKFGLLNIPNMPKSSSKRLIG